MSAADPEMDGITSSVPIDGSQIPAHIQAQMQARRSLVVEAHRGEYSYFACQLASIAI